MKRDMTALMTTIDESLAQLQLGASKLLRPGLPAQTVTEELTARGLRPGADLIALYGWHDGTNSDPDVLLNDMYLMPGYYLLSLAEALEIYDRFVNEYHENSSWLPLLEDNAGGYVFVDCSAIDHQPVYDFNFENVENKLKHNSIRDMLATLAAAFTQGIFYKDGDGWFDMKDDAFWKLAAKMNPTAQYWTED
ncbi:SMI1/KNR4 family protein [Paenarthrobacter aurescens]|nr:SMI1/KNR4 family protein [Paenarthrobacter aurescens]MDO6142724.1 SMI1/KNR4 family protein [Paenarthrobacter aurescens]MDO6146571.1 SMI1/KNR4 family protein [Paenarthrobacter aurescens]MDO6157816.1 SMI1/KNR4 family protein [Paenarthrobacter aurescens]MDO6161801.1 SMI1/KNR4 family protein [Paenarthrobacter aurescens]